ncbi:MAG: T9SS type A sorting domain-containing protein [Bacteroidetes bacterium]|nr:T9SS type A sorting domain-containing protein [Bacteroidota bacterium]MCW5896520.1 T9SS type A sorting domain-containing protein [Bacteroidota bacterium]
MARLVLSLAVLLSFPLASLAQWLQQVSPSTELLWKIRFTDAANGWIVGQTRLYRTTDGGQSWSPKDTVMNLGSLRALSGDVAIYCEGWLGTGPNRGIRKTTDGGSSWRSVDTARYVYNDAKFPTPQIGYAAGREASTQQYVPAIRKTTDGGETWATIFSLNGGVDFQAVSFLDPDNGWAMTYSPALIYRTTNAGAVWTFQDTVGLYNGTTYPMRDLAFTTLDSGWAVGGIAGTSVISKTTNGGQSWIHSSGISNTIQEIAMINSRVGWIVGRVWNAPPQRTTDGGVTWHVQSTSPNLPAGGSGIYSISMLDENNGWLIFNPQGRVYKTTNGGATSVENNEVLPSAIQLFQNYPNPFNPGTHIKFTIVRQGFVSLKVFDLSGREVATLLERDMSVGEHSVEWKPENLASGVYLYQLRHGATTETRKLVLLR